GPRWARPRSPDRRMAPMSSTVSGLTHAVASAHPAVPFTATLRSEWTKLMTVRTTYVMLALSAVLSLGATALLCWAVGWSWGEWSEADRAAFDPIMSAFGGLILTTVLFVALGVHFVTSEYASGMVRLTLTTTPRRGRVLLAKVT